MNVSSIKIEEQFQENQTATKRNTTSNSIKSNTFSTELITLLAESSSNNKKDEETNVIKKKILDKNKEANIKLKLNINKKTIQAPTESLFSSEKQEKDELLGVLNSCDLTNTFKLKDGKFLPSNTEIKKLYKNKSDGENLVAIDCVPNQNQTLTEYPKFQEQDNAFQSLKTETSNIQKKEKTAIRSAQNTDEISTEKLGIEEIGQEQRAKTDQLIMTKQIVTLSSDQQTKNSVLNTTTAETIDQKTQEAITAKRIQQKNIQLITSTDNMSESKTAFVIRVDLNQLTPQPLSITPHALTIQQLNNQIPLSKTASNSEIMKNLNEEHNLFIEQKSTALIQQFITILNQQTLNDSQMSLEQIPMTHISSQFKTRISEQVAEHIYMIMSKNLKHINIQFDPSELGKIQIRMNVSNDSTTVNFTVVNPQTKDIIEQSIPRLREMLAQQGIQLSDTSVQQQNSEQENRYLEQSRINFNPASNDIINNQKDTKVDLDLSLNITTKHDGISCYA
ncbi:flagellar hook-length control protein [Candidatus Photodesmus blepharus]|uniref:Flagellar hook-length control protein n=1 Tax=Candidatus Photodesmus blepharonis TaxID=1179155 RepID=A0A084CNZ8_9GAMM|nr:flagellar hook-length control protein FliK [Candidatus Photodesmus blepharus]KEY91527.1 flagellar hook-length control protein [Candidatus Photodesmus blepharus]